MLPKSPKHACLQYLWSCIFETLAVLIVLSFQIRMSVLPALAVMAVFLPLQFAVLLGLGRGISQEGVI